MGNRRSGAKKSLKAELRERKDVPCARCGISYPYYVMDFFHTKGRKRFSISQMVGSNEDPEEIRRLVMLELEKCSILCANCSREEGHRPTGNSESLSMLNRKIANASKRRR